MGRETNRLTALEVTRKKRPGLFADGGGLCLQVQPGADERFEPNQGMDFSLHAGGAPAQDGHGSCCASAAR